MTPTDLDYNASAPARDAALDAFRRVAALSGNASSVHGFGRAGRRALEDARERVATAIGASPRQVVFTSGGTESNNLAILGTAAARAVTHIVTSAIEHPAVRDVCRHLQARGVRVTVVPVNRDGRVNAEDVAAAIDDDTTLVSVMWVNNETGVIQPVEEIAHLARQRGVAFHCDAVQAVGRERVNVTDTPVDLLTLSGHKFGAPHGAGALFVREPDALSPAVHGGGQERGLRSGTSSPALASALAVALEETLATRAAEETRLREPRDRLEARVLASIPELAVNGAGAPRVANTSNLRVPGADGEALVMALDAAGFAVSSASACASAHRATSHVLTAMGLSPRDADASLRVSLGYRTTADDVDNFGAALEVAVARVRASIKPPR
jgi:cysteine desulfurase